MTAPSDPIGEVRTVIVRLRRAPDGNAWRGEALCVQTGITTPVLVLLDAEHAAVPIALALIRLLIAPPGIEQADEQRK